MKNEKLKRLKGLKRLKRLKGRKRCKGNVPLVASRGVLHPPLLATSGEHGRRIFNEAFKDGQKGIVPLHASRDVSESKGGCNTPLLSETRRGFQAE